MVKLEYRPYLIALLGLTVCISLWEIAFVQWDTNDHHINTHTGRPQALFVVGSNDSWETALKNGSKQNKTFDPSAPAEDRDKAGNRGILSSGRINQEASGQDETSVAAVGLQFDGGDYKSLIDMDNDFEFLINQPPCPKNSPGRFPDFLVQVLVHSAPRNFLKRLAIRQTWGSHPDPAMKVYFLLGAVSSPALQFKLEMENERFGDLIQGSFKDAYRNMTYKHVMALKWFSYHCASTPVMLKTDDDVFVNAPALMEYMRENVNGIRNRRNFVNCKVVHGATVKRSYRSKWRVSVREYANAVYPDYCPGFIVLYTSDIVEQLYRSAQTTKYFWIDDVHVTGTLREQVNATLSPFRDIYFTKGQRKRLREPYVRNMPLFSQPDLTERDIRKMWAMVGGTKGMTTRRGFKEDAEAVALLARYEGTAAVDSAWMLRLSWVFTALVAVVSSRISMTCTGCG